MLKMLANRYFSILYTLGVLLTAGRISVAQVTPDNTVGTQVNTSENVSEITGGETRGENLFHSFQDFSVPTNNEAFFNNSNDISNIFSRVTGGNVSNIDGLIRANGSASLFLINPAGIMFGENASLNLGGSFYGSTADSILFEDGEFSAANPDATPLLTINAPIGFSFRDNPGDITGSQATLRVNDGQDLFLLGGNLNFDSGLIAASGGRVELGALTGSGIIAINEDGSLNFPEAVARGDISFNNLAQSSPVQISVVGDPGGSVGINARNLSLTSVSRIFAGINVDSGSIDAQSGDVVINLTEDLVIDNSNVTNSNFGIGNAGNVNINARNVTFSNGGIIFNFNSGGEGNIGDTVITATGDISFDGTSGSFNSGIGNSFNDGATGNVGAINLTAQNLSITDGARIANNVVENIDGGDINLNIVDTVIIDGSRAITDADGAELGVLPSTISTNTFGNGNSGDINLSTQNLFLSRNGSIDALASSDGNAGNININAELITIGEPGNSNILPSSINVSSGVSVTDDNPDVIANGGNVNINTGSLRISDGGSIDASVSSDGNGGNIVINAREEVSIAGSGTTLNLQGEEVEVSSSIEANLNSMSSGRAGNIEINTASLFIDGGFISADVLGNGDGGNITIDATDSVSVIGNAESFSFISADIRSGATGEAGNIEINTSQLVLEKAFISTDIVGDGKGGAIDLNISDSIELSNLSYISADVLQGSTGNGGNLNIETGRLTLNDGSQISATTLGRGNAGTINISADESISLSGVRESSRGGILANAVIEDGNGGNINLTTGELTITDGAIITASNFPSFGEESETALGTGEPGNIAIAAESLRLSDEGRIEAVTQAETGTGANINLQIADTIFLTGDSFISAQARGNANGGNLNIDTDFIVAFEGNNDIIASAERGTGGNINITAESLLGIKERPLSPTTNDINASSEFGIDGNVSIGVLDLDSFEGVRELATSVVEPEQTVAQICNADGELTAQSSLIVRGIGGISPTPDLPLNSDNIITQPGSTSSNLPEPLKTSKGDIQPARGIKVTETGVILTAYHTDNNGRRLTNTNTSCGVREDRG